MRTRRSCASLGIAGGLSVLAHLAAFSGLGLGLSARVAMPRLEVHEVAGIPVPSAEPGGGEAEGSAEARPESREDSGEPTTPPPPLPVEPPERREASGALLASSDDLDRPPPEPPAAQPPGPAAPDGGVDGGDGEAEPVRPETLALPGSASRGELSGLMVGQARVALLVRGRALAESPAALPLRQTIRQVPGFSEYFGSAAFDPLTDLEWMVLRTSDPSTLVLSVVTAALTTDASRARALVERVPGRPGAVSWGPASDGGPEVARVEPPPGQRPAAVFWAVVEPGPLLLAGVPAWVESEASDPAGAAARALAGLGEVRLGDGPPDLVIAAERIAGMVEAPGASWPLPEGLVAAARFGEPAVVRADLFFGSPGDARRFAAGVARDLERWSAHPLARLIDLPGLTEHLVVERHGARVAAEVRLEPTGLRRLLALVRLLLAVRSGAEPELSTFVDEAEGRP